MLIGPFDTGPFIELAQLAKIPTNRTPRGLENQCQSCIRQFDAIGKELTAFTTTVEDNRDLFEFLADVLRSTKRINFKFASAAQLHSELMSIRNVVRKMRCGSEKADYDLFASFASAIETVIKARARVAA